MKRVFLETERLILREMDEDDFGALMSMLGDGEVMYAWEHAFSEEEGRAWLARRRKGYADNGFDYFLAVEKTSNTVVGQIGLLKEVLGDETLYGIGWILKRSEWHKGYAFEGAHALLDYGFRLLDLPEIVADIRPENTASRRVAEKLGMHETNTVVKIVGGKEMPHIIYRMKNPYHVHCTFRLPKAGEKYPLSALTELQTMAERDASVRAQLAETCELARSGYHPVMEGVHLCNSLRLEEIVGTYGFPVMDVAGREATDNAWIILQHAIGRPAFLRAALAFFETLNGYELPPSHYAYLSDRVAFYERRAQNYGTQFDYNLNGEFAPWWVAHPDSLSIRRGAVGLPCIDEVKARLLSDGTPPAIPLKDAFKMRLLQEKWLLNVGWCTLFDIEKSREEYGF